MLNSTGSPRLALKTECSELVVELKKQLAGKERLITDLRLDSLTAAHQLDAAREALGQFRTEVSALRQEKERLERVLPARSAASSRSSLASAAITSPTEVSGLREAADGEEGRKNGPVAAPGGDSLSEMFLRLDIGGKKE